MKKIIIIMVISLFISLVSIKADYAHSSELVNAVSALKIIAGDAVNYPDADVDGNGKVELKDAVYALQIAAGFRAGMPDIVLLIPTATDTVKLAWLPVSDSTTSASEMNYEVHLSKQQNFQPSVSTCRATVKGEIQKEITGLETGTTYYAVIVAVDKEQNQTKGKYGSVTTFALPLIKSSITSEIDKNLGLYNAVQNGTEYTYPKTADAEMPQVGSVLFVNVGEDVYLRKVSAVNTTAGNIVVQTGDAELEEVFDQATVDTNLTLFDVNEVSSEKSVRKADGSYNVIRWKDDLLVAEQTDHAFETDDVSLSQRSGQHEIRIKERSEEKAGVNAGVSFTPALNTRILWKKTSQGIAITGAEVIAKGTLSAYIDAYYNFSAAGSVEKEIPFPLFTRILTTRYMLGAVPVYQRTTFSLKAVIIASAESEIKADANAKASAGIEMGVRYNLQTGAWDVIPLSPDFQKSFTADISVHGGVHGEVRLIPNIQVEFYRMLAADLSIEPFLAGDIQAETTGKADILQGMGYLATQLTQFDFYLQAEGFIGVSFGIFSKKIPLLNKTKIYTSPKWILFSLPKLEVSGGSGKVGEPITLNATTTNGTNNPFNEGSIRWLSYPNKGSVSGGKIGSFTADEEGIYTVFFSGNSRIDDPFGRQFLWADVNVTDGSVPPHGIANRCPDIKNRCLDLSNQCPSGTCNPVDENGKLHGTSVCKDGDYTYLRTYIHGVLQGSYGMWDKDCIQVHHSNYANGQRDGVVIDVFTPNDDYFIRTYVKGGLNGYSGAWKISDCTPVGTYLYESGSYEAYYGHGNYVNDRKDGVWTVPRCPYGSCTMDYSIGTYSIETYDNGVLNGYSGSWKNCVPREWHGNYLNGQRDGVWTYINYLNNNSYYKETYVNGILQGFHSEYTAEGKPTGCNGNYINGQKSGVWTCYRSDGTTYTETYP